jgi:hypothetical protein
MGKLTPSAQRLDTTRCEIPDSHLGNQALVSQSTDRACTMLFSFVPGITVVLDALFSHSSRLFSCRSLLLPDGDKAWPENNCDVRMMATVSQAIKS